MVEGVDKSIAFQKLLDPAPTRSPNMSPIIYSDYMTESFTKSRVGPRKELGTVLMQLLRSQCVCV